MGSRGRDVPAPPRPDPALRRDAAEPLKRDRSGERALAEAFESGREILTRLNEQGESLQRSEVVADSNQYVLDRSARTLSNMTWSGWIANTFRPAPKPPPPPPARRAAAFDPPSAPPPPLPELESAADRRALFAGAAAAPPSGAARDGLAEQEAYIERLAAGLDGVLGVSVAIGDEAEDHAERVPRLSEKMDQLWASTRAVTRRAGRLTGGGGAPKFLGHVALRETVSKRYLRARGDDVALSEEVDVLRATCRFALYEKHAHLLGLRSPVSGRWLGLTFGGDLACSAKRLGNWETWDLDLSKRGLASPQPLAALGANWGGGCWVKAAAGRDPRRVALGGPLADADARRAAARFDVAFLDGVYIAPAYAEQRLVRVHRAPARDSDDAREGFLCPECRFRAFSPESLSAHYAAEHPP